MMKPMNEMSLSFLSYSANEGFARATVAAFVAQMDPTVGEISDIKTAVSEAVTNCIIHAYRDVIGMIYISVKIFENGKVVIRIRDKGCGIEDVEKAKELLAEAGYPDGFDLVIRVPDNYKPHESTAEIIVESLKEVGINATIQLDEFSSWVEEVYTGRDFQATIVAVDGTLSPGSWLEKNPSDAPKNFTNYSNAEFDETYAAALATVDDDEKVELYKKCQMILAEDAASVYIQDAANLVAVNEKLDGYVFYPCAAQDMSGVHFVE